MKLLTITLLSMLLTAVMPNLSQAQGLNFNNDASGSTTVTPLGNGYLQIDISGHAAKKIFLQLKADTSSRQFDGKNPAGRIVDKYYSNSGMICSSNLLFESFHCIFKMLNGRIIESSGASTESRPNPGAVR